MIKGEPIKVCLGNPVPFSRLEDGQVATESYELGNSLVRFQRWSGVPGGGWWVEIGESGE